MSRLLTRDRIDEMVVVGECIVVPTIMDLSWLELDSRVRQSTLKSQLSIMNYEALQSHTEK